MEVGYFLEDVLQVLDLSEAGQLVPQVEADLEQLVFQNSPHYLIKIQHFILSFSSFFNICTFLSRSQPTPPPSPHASLIIFPSSVPSIPPALFIPLPAPYLYLSIPSLTSTISPPSPLPPPGLPLPPPRLYFLKEFLRKTRQ